VAVFHVTQDGNFRVTNVPVLRIVQGGKFTRNTVLQFYVYDRMAILRVTQGGYFTCSTCGSFTYSTGWLFTCNFGLQYSVR